MSLRPFMGSGSPFFQLNGGEGAAPALVPRRYGTVLPVNGTGSLRPAGRGTAPGAGLLTSAPSYPIRRLFSHFPTVMERCACARLVGVGLVFSSERSGEVGRNFRIEGYAIASADGMIADSTGFMPIRSNSRPTSAFFLQRLDRAAGGGHGRLSHEGDASCAPAAA